MKYSLGIWPARISWVPPSPWKWHSRKRHQRRRRQIRDAELPARSRLFSWSNPHTQKTNSSIIFYGVPYQILLHRAPRHRLLSFSLLYCQGLGEVPMENALLYKSISIRMETPSLGHLVYPDSQGSGKTPSSLYSFYITLHHLCQCVLVEGRHLALIVETLAYSTWILHVLSILVELVWWIYKTSIRRKIKKH